MNEHIMITLSGIVVLGMACQIIAWRLQQPAILFLLLTGFLLGPISGIFHPDELLGDLLFPVVSLGVAIILFEGALTLKFEEISKTARVMWMMVSVGAVITLAVGASAAHYILGIDFKIALLFGAIITVTGPTVIMPLLRSVRPSHEVSNILRWEGIVIDPLGAMLAVLVYEYATLEHSGEVWITLAKFAVTGVALGYISGWFLAIVIRRHWIPDFLMKICILAYVIGMYTLCDILQAESGLLAVTIMGIFLANQKDLYMEEILDFKESLSILIISGLFIVLSARMEFEVFTHIGWNGLWILASVMFIARPLSILISTFGSTLRWQERALLAWIAPRGIIAAAIAPLFALKLEVYGVEEASYLPPLVFTIIIGTVVIQSLTAAWVAKLLGVAEPEDRGVLIIGANRLARTIGKALQDHGFPVLLTDTNWDDLSEARMQGLKTFFGNAVSEHADRHLDLVGIGKLIAISKRPSLNILACLRYKREFGSNKIYMIKTEEERRTREKDHVSAEFHVPFLTKDAHTQSELTGLLTKGYEIKSTTLTENFTYKNYIEKNEQAVLLFAINKKEILHCYHEMATFTPDQGWTILSLVSSDKKS